MQPAIILSCHITGLAVVRALGKMGVPVTAVYYNAKDMGYVSRYVRKTRHAPHPVNEEKRFLEMLLDLAGDDPGGVLIPTDDETLQTVSRHRDLLRKHFIVACPDWRTTEACLDKKYTYAMAERVGIPTPKTLVPCSTREMQAFGEAVGYPCLIKPCQSHRYFQAFGRKMTKVENYRHMMVEYHRANQAGIEVMIQEYIPGKVINGVNYNAYFWEGRALMEFTAQKVRYAPSEFGIPCVVVSRAIPEIVEYGRRLLEELGYGGFSCTEFKRDPRDGRFKLMEVNCRHNRSGWLAIHCGVNFPWIEYNHLTRGILPLQSDPQDNVFWIDEVNDIICSLRLFGKKRQPLIQYLEPYRNRHVFALFDAGDMKPFLKRCLNLAGTAFRMKNDRDPSCSHEWARSKSGRKDGRCETSTTA